MKTNNEDMQGPEWPGKLGKVQVVTGDITANRRPRRPSPVRVRFLPGYLEAALTSSGTLRPQPTRAMSSSSGKVCNGPLNEQKIPRVSHGAQACGGLGCRNCNPAQLQAVVTSCG
jgi:hypothetical protein